MPKGSGISAVSVIGFAFACKPGPDIDLSELAAEYESYLSWSTVEGHEYEPESFDSFVEWAQSGKPSPIDDKASLV